MRRFLKILLIGGMLVNLLGLTSCDLTGREKRKEDAKNLALKLLEEKYGEKFQISDAYYDSGLIAYFSPVEHPEVIFEATVSLTHEMLYGDSYPSNIIATRIQQECEVILDKLDIKYYLVIHMRKYDLNEENLASSDFTSKEHIDTLYTNNVNDIIESMEITFEIYTIDETLSYDSVKLYECISQIQEQYPVLQDNSIFRYIFVSNDRFDDIKQHYSECSFDSQGFDGITGYTKNDYAAVVRVDGFLRETQEEFEEMINRVKEYHGVK